MGDPAGVGPEVILKVLAVDGVCPEAQRAKVVGSAAAMSEWSRRLGLSRSFEVIDVGDAPADPGRPSEEGAAASLRAIEIAARMCQSGDADAMVTGPVSKAAISSLGVDFPGHTEFLAGLVGAGDVVMTFVCEGLRIGLATTHLPLSEVSGSITAPVVTSKLRILDSGLRAWFGIAEPRIAVAALNPHSGERGLLGDEEATILGPALAEARAEGIRVEGPFPADALFARACGEFDATLAMYHDQGTIPAKLLAGGAGVNVTMGLPIIRTSVDHGTAFDEAGRGTADARSMAAALGLAREIARRAIR
jgi:4-hydroxythreonine-4-phosphate dehydrogenase